MSEVDLKLVFAVDASDSIEAWEWRLELAGIAAGLRDPEVRDAIAALPRRRIAVALLVWADAKSRRDTSGWRLIDSDAAADAFATEVDAFPRAIGGGTAMGEGVAEAVRMILSSRYSSGRQIIDVSGDGAEPLPIFTYVMMPEARAMAEAAGITINGLAIEKGVPNLFRWYRENVMTGSGAFVLRARDMNDFARAFREKLLRELQPELALRPWEADGKTLI